MRIHDVSWAYRSSGPATVRISFSHIRRPLTRWSRSCRLRPHQSLISSSHSLHGRPFRGFPSIFANTVCLVSLFSFILHMCPNSLSFRFFIVSMVVSSIAIACHMSSFHIISFQRTLNIRW